MMNIRTTAAAIFATAVIAGVGAAAQATDGDAYTCPPGTTFDYKIEPYSGFTFTVPTPPAGWTVTGVIIKVGGPGGGTHLTYTAPTPGTLIDVSFQQHEISHVHVCKSNQQTTTTTTSPSTTTTLPEETTTSTSTPTTTSTTDPSTTDPGVTTTTDPGGATTTVPGSTPSSTEPSTTSTEPSSTSIVSTTQPSASSSAPATGTGGGKLPATGAEDTNTQAWAGTALAGVGLALYLIGRYARR
jgi:LPXTG-motif cell wall-anchored protein